jgi:hypothetical protein
VNPRDDSRGARAARFHETLNPTGRKEGGRGVG